MIRSLFSGVSGLKTHQQRMDVIGNNISNVNTIGYKSSTVTFKDIYYQTIKSATAATSVTGGTNPAQIGYGTSLGNITPNMTRSGFQSSSKYFDVAIAGEGFFQVMDAKGNVLYTRAGSLQPDPNGNLIDMNGNKVLGVSGEYTGTEASTNPIVLVVPSVDDNNPSASKEINGATVTLSGSIPTDNGNITVKFNNGSYPFATFTGGILEINFDMTRQYETEADFQNAVTDALNAGGIELPDDMQLNISFANVPNAQEAAAVAAENSFTFAAADGTNPAKKLTFTADNTGNFANNYQIAFRYIDGADATSASWDKNILTININKDTTIDEIQDAIDAAAGSNENRNITVSGDALPTDETEMKAAFANNPKIRLQDGKDSFYTEVSNLLGTFNMEDGRTAKTQTYTDLESITVGNDGTIVGYHSVHGYIELGRIDIATFENPAGLLAMGNSYFSESPASGTAKTTIPGQNGSGELVSGSLEMSNVDLSEEFSNMIITQRGFQANSRVITTSDTILEELINLKR